MTQQLISRDGELECYVPGIKLTSLNRSLRGVSRGSMLARAQAAQKQRYAVGMVLCVAFGNMPPEGPLCVTVTRVHPGRGLDPHDNLPGACKHVVDAIADWLGRDDRDPSITWRYAQKSCGKEVGVGIRIAKRILWRADLIAKDWAPA